MESVAQSQDTTRGPVECLSRWAWSRLKASSGPSQAHASLPLPLNPHLQHWNFLLRQRRLSGSPRLLCRTP